jgi:hypothetical protein
LIGSKEKGMGEKYNLINKGVGAHKGLLTWVKLEQTKNKVIL